jgi:non-canonical purine NTP pyrophosphatase (RdgB/HAM1 family)
MKEKLYFITGNQGKFNEVKSIIPYTEQMKLDLPEIQENCSQAIIEEKLKEAERLHPDLEFIVEDTSLYFDSLNGLPGPLIKWFMDKNSLNRLYNICDKLGDYNAQAKTMIGYRTKDGHHHFFEGTINGEIIKPTVKINFGWRPILNRMDTIFLLRKWDKMKDLRYQ